MTKPRWRCSGPCLLFLYAPQPGTSQRPLPPTLSIPDRKGKHTRISLTKNSSFLDNYPVAETIWNFTSYFPPFSSLKNQTPTYVNSRLPRGVAQDGASLDVAGSFVLRHLGKRC